MCMSSKQAEPSKDPHPYQKLANFNKVATLSTSHVSHVFYPHGNVHSTCHPSLQRRLKRIPPPPPLPPSSSICQLLYLMEAAKPHSVAVAVLCSTGWPVSASGVLELKAHATMPSLLATFLCQRKQEWHARQLGACHV